MLWVCEVGVGMQNGRCDLVHDLEGLVACICVPSIFICANIRIHKLNVGAIGKACHNANHWLGWSYPFLVCEANREPTMP